MVLSFANEAEPSVHFLEFALTRSKITYGKSLAICKRIPFVFAVRATPNIFVTRLQFEF
jgi:hypothetical protein